MAIRQTKEKPSAQDDFLAILPEIGRLLRWCFRHEDADRREESVQEAVCQCWGMYTAAHHRGKRLSAHGLAWYGWLATRGGRRFCWESKRGVQKWTSLETVNLDDLLASDFRGHWGVADAAAFRVDWQEFISDCSRLDRRIVALLALGHRRIEVARRLHLSPAAITGKMQRLRQTWEERFGPGAA